TAAILEQLGVPVTEIDADTALMLVVAGRGVDALHEPAGVLDCGNSGTTMRTVAGLLAGRPFLSVLSGDESLQARPMARVVEPLRAMGAQLDGRAGGTLAPLVVRGGGLRGMSHDLAVASAQVKTALVLAGLQAGGVTEVTEPAPSRDHTERMLAALGAPVSRAGNTLVVREGAPEAFELRVPGDPSSAAFWCVAATITPGSEVVIEGVSLNETRIGFVDVLQRMGADIDVVRTGEQLGEPVGDLRVVAAALRGTTIGGDEVPLVQDEIPVLAVAAAFADGLTEISDAAELRVKESDRIATVTELLTGLGVGVEAQSDGLRIRGGSPHAGEFASHRDHRIAMAAAVSAHALDAESIVTGWSAATVSYPEFLTDLDSLTGRRRGAGG
ncbi:MAG TPA: 3-phosphoshikimate 1-carboxyvinyltransferase, partial [Acidimicrobiia bacterium]|nr:3-phosphoshikimate 1-carboxyvinyltransferase [Acidimicrobiia bacterium]